MQRTTAEIAREIESFVPAGEDWLPLETLLSELWDSGSPESAIPQLIRLFERNPESDGHGVLWSVLHGLESLPDYQPALVRSVADHPSLFGVMMIGRLLNAGITHAQGVSLLGALRNTASATSSQQIREAAECFLEQNS